MKREGAARIFLNQWDLKIIALAAALLLSIYVRYSDPIETRTLTVTPRLLNLPGGFVVKDTGLLKLKATLEGTASVLAGLSPDSMVFYAEFPEIQDEGTFELPVNVERVPSGVALLDYPRRISVAISHYRQQEFPIEVVFIGAVPEGMQSSTPIIQPSVVSLKGPTSDMERVRRVVCYLQAAEIPANPTMSLPIVALDERDRPVAGVNATPATVSIRVSASFAATAKAIPVRPQLLGNPPYGYHVDSIRLEPQVAIVRGRPQALDLIDSIDTEPIDLSNAMESLVFDHLKLQYDSQQISATPVTVSIAIGIKPSKVSMRYSVPVTVKYMGRGRFTARPAEVFVTLYGLLPALQQVSLHQIEVLINVTQTMPGTYIYKPRVKAPNDLQVLAIWPEEVSIEIKR